MDRLRRDDSGVTLVEMLVYSLLLGLVFALVGGILVNSLTTQRDVRAMSETTSAGQVVIRSFDRVVRNATEMEIPAVFGGDLIIVKSRQVDPTDDPDTWICRAWHFDEAAGELRTMSDSATGTPATVGLTTAVDSSGWVVAVDDVVRSTDGAGNPLPVFAMSDVVSASIRFDLETGKASNQLSFTSASTARPQGTTIGGSSCW